MDGAVTDAEEADLLPIAGDAVLQLAEAGQGSTSMEIRSPGLPYSSRDTGALGSRFFRQPRLSRLGALVTVEKGTWNSRAMGRRWSSG